MEERVTEDDGKQRRWKRDNDNGGAVDSGKYDEDEGEAGNVDSGFLSGGNLQFSGEISGDSGLLHSREEGQWGVGEGERERPTTGLASEVTTPASSATASAVVANEEPMRAIDSGVDLDLTETLSQLSLKQVSLNPLAAKSKLIQAEPTTPELLPVSASFRRDDEDDTTFEQHHQQHHQQRDRDEQPATCNEEAWQLYYTQDDDGDT